MSNIIYILENQQLTRGPSFFKFKKAKIGIIMRIFANHLILIK